MRMDAVLGGQREPSSPDSRPVAVNLAVRSPREKRQSSPSARKERRARQDSNLRPSDPKSLGQPTTEIDGDESPDDSGDLE
jgi:hypothetical protein